MSQGLAYPVDHNSLPIILAASLANDCRFLVYDSDRVTIRNCTAYSNLAKDEEGGGFALDVGVTNSVIEYCTAYDNWGSGYKVAARPNNISNPFAGQQLIQRIGANNTIRYSTSRGDGNGIKYASILVSADPGSTVVGLTVHGNTITVTDTIFCDYWGYQQSAHYGLFLQGPSFVKWWVTVPLSGGVQCRVATGCKRLFLP